MHKPACISINEHLMIYENSVVSPTFLSTMGQEDDFLVINRWRFHSGNLVAAIFLEVIGVYNHIMMNCLIINDIQYILLLTTPPLPYCDW